MARFHSPQISDFPFHVTGRRHNKAPFDIELDEVWKIMCELLYLTKRFFDLKVHAFVLMPNHYHLICSSNSAPLGTAIGYFMRESSKTMNAMSGKVNQNWGSRYYRCELDVFTYYMNCYKYVYQNPVRAGLTTKCENWKYSTLHGLLGRSHLLIPVEADTLLFSESGLLQQENLSWLNQLPDPENLNSVRAALKKVRFKLPKQKTKANFLENGLF